MLVNRPKLIERIRPFYGNGLVKVITGLRRTGKSTLLRLIANDMTAVLGRPEASFLFLNFERLALSRLRDPLALHEAVTQAAARSPARLTVFLDEIQNVPEWETCINSLRAEDLCDIFVTGSNSRLLSGELATHLAGRTIQIQVFPFSFSEFREARRQQAAPGDASDSAVWKEYLLYGGMPGVLQYRSLPAAHQYLADVFEAVVLKDVAQRYGIRQGAVLEAVCRYLLMEAGHRISPLSIEKFLKSEKLSVSRDTLLDYLQAGTEAFAFERLEGEDLQGKKLLRFRPKLYCADHGFREAVFPGSNEKNIDQVLENIVCIELRRRGWLLKTGDAADREIDFIAERDGKRLYVQVCYLLAAPETIRREFEPLRMVRDNWPKLVLSLDPVSRSQDGIEHRNIIEFLLSEDF